MRRTTSLSTARPFVQNTPTMSASRICLSMRPISTEQPSSAPQIATVTLFRVARWAAQRSAESWLQPGNLSLSMRVKRAQRRNPRSSRRPRVARRAPKVATIRLRLQLDTGIAMMRKTKQAQAVPNTTFITMPKRNRLT